MLDPSFKTRKLVVKNIGNEQCGVLIQILIFVTNKYINKSQRKGLKQAKNMDGFRNYNYKKNRYAMRAYICVRR